MKKHGLTIIISHADSTLGRRMSGILARHGAEMILLYQKSDPTLRLVKKIYACGSDCVMIPLEGKEQRALQETLAVLQSDNAARQFIYIN